MTRGTLVTMASSVFGLVGLASFALAQPGNWYGCPWSDEATPVELRLTQEQARKIGEIRSKYEAQLLPLEKERAVTTVELETALSGGDVPADKVAQLRRKARDLERQIEDLQEEANAAALQLLTPEQRRYYGDDFELFDSGYGWGSRCQGWDRMRGGDGMAQRSLERGRMPMDCCACR